MTYGRPANTAPSTTSVTEATDAGAPESLAAPANPVAANANAYLRTQVLTASPEQLRLMLLDGAIKHLRQGHDGLERKDYFASFDGFSKARNIIMELMNSMKPEVAPDLCARVQSLLLYMYRLVVDAGLEKDASKAAEALKLLEYERETWLLAIEKAAEERTGISKPVLKLDTVGEPAEHRVATAAASAKTAYRPLSVQG